jgi:hypothetical protein
LSAFCPPPVLISPPGERGSGTIHPLLLCPSLAILSFDPAV